MRRRRREWIFGVVLSLLGVPLLTAQQQRSSAKPFAGTSYTRTVWRATDGLPEDTVQALTEASDGQLWIGTTGGSSVFDGEHIRPFHADTSPPPGVNSAFCLLAERNGVVWEGTEGGGLLRIDGRHARLFASADGLTDGFVRVVFRDREGKLWVGTDDGLFQQQGQHFVRMDGHGELARMAVHAITEDGAHRLWVGGSVLVALAPDGSVQHYTLPWAYSESRVKSILQTRDGTVWVGTVAGLARWEHGSFRAMPELHATVRTLLQSNDGTLWVGTIGNGLWTYRADQLARVAPRGLLPSDTILALFQDENGQLWIGTQSGMVRLHSTPVHLIALPGAEDSDFETIVGDHNGAVHVAAQRLYRIEGTTARLETFPGLSGVHVRNFFESREGDRWIGTDGSGAYRISPDGKLTHFSAPAELTNNFIRAFWETRDGDVWIATDEGVSSIGKNGIRKLTQANGLVYFSTRCLLEDRSGILWIGTDRGLSAWSNGRFLSSAATKALAREKVWAMLEDHQGTVWFGTRDHGLFREREGRVEQITTEQGLPGNSIYQLLEDRRGFLWITGPNTIASVSLAALDGAMPTAEQPVGITTYSMPFGAEDAQLYGGRQPAGYVAADDSVWFPTTRGVAHVERVAQERTASSLRAVILGLTEDGRAATLEDGLSVSSGVTRLSFEFSAVSLRPRNNLRLRYMLEGLDRDWVPAGASELATYTNLKPGHYRFRVQAFEAGDPGVVSEAVLRLTKSRYFYQAWWFYVLCAALAGILGWSTYQLRVRQLRTRFAAVLEERTRLAREIHDTVIQGCTGLSAVLEAMSIEAAGSGARPSELLDYAREQTRGVIDEARRAVWNMRSEKEEQLDFTHALRALAGQTMREHRGIRVDVQRESPAWLRSSVHHEAIMVVREAVGNAVQHSGTERIEIGVMDAARALIVTVRDFGCGIAPEAIEEPAAGHFGLVGIRERMRRLGGQLELVSASDTGTTVRLTLPRTGLRSIRDKVS